MLWLVADQPYNGYRGPEFIHLQDSRLISIKAWPEMVEGLLTSCLVTKTEEEEEDEEGGGERVNKGNVPGDVCVQMVYSG